MLHSYHKLCPLHLTPRITEVLLWPQCPWSNITRCYYQMAINDVPSNRTVPILSFQQEWRWCWDPKCHRDGQCWRCHRPRKRRLSRPLPINWSSGTEGVQSVLSESKYSSHAIYEFWGRLSSGCLKVWARHRWHQNQISYKAAVQGDLLMQRMDESCVPAWHLDGNSSAWTSLVSSVCDTTTRDRSGRKVARLSDGQIGVATGGLGFTDLRFTFGKAMSTYPEGSQLLRGIDKSYVIAPLGHLIEEKYSPYLRFTPMGRSQAFIAQEWSMITIQWVLSSKGA